MENRINSIANKIDEIKEFYNTNLGKATQLESQIDEKTKEYDELMDKQTELLTMKTILDEASTEARENGRQILSQVSSSAMQMIFEGDTTVDLKLGRKSGEAVADVEIVNTYKDGTVIDGIDPIDEDAGGLADIIALTFFLTFSELGAVNNTAPFMLDEPTKFVSRGEYSQKSSEFIKGIVSHMGKQTILSTHDDYLLNTGDVAYRLVKNPDTGVTEVKREI